MLSLALSCGVLFAHAKDKVEKKNEYKFTKVYDNAATSVKDQCSSGTCWSFSGLSFVESEILRNGGKSPDLSEMYIVRKCYEDKAQMYFRMHGYMNFSQGGNFNDILHVWKKYGLVPQEVYNGLEYGETEHKHSEVSTGLKAYLDVIIKNKNKRVSTAWKGAYSGILDAYFGVEPEEFEFAGQKYTPKTYTKEHIKLNPNDYVQLTSYTHHPFYSAFILQIPDNWTLSKAYNVPLNELSEVANNVLKVGGTFAWASDVSEKGFSFKNGLALIPEITAENIADDSERAKWDNLTKREKGRLKFDFKKPLKEKKITQEMRQVAYDNYETTDDHGMHIVGLYKDQTGKEYYKVKNSWNTNNIYDGYFYASKPFFEYKTMSIMVNKKDIPEHIRKKLGL